MPIHPPSLASRTGLALGLSLALAAPAFAASAASADGELIPRSALFGNPERSGAQISPDGRYLSWLAPVNGVMNVWVAPTGEPAKARAVTDDAARGIRSYAWSYRSGTLLYLRDSGGDENFHLYSVDVAQPGAARDLTPYPKTRASLVRLAHRHPDRILVGMNDRDPKWHDLYEVDLGSGQRKLALQNNDRLAGYLADGDLKVGRATRSREDGGSELLASDGKGGWKVVDTVPFEDSQTTEYEGYSDDGQLLYLTDSRGRDTAALYAIDAAGKKSLLLEDARADVGARLTDPASDRVQAASVYYLRQQWKPLDPAIGQDLRWLQDKLGAGEVSVASRSLDDKTWVVNYGAAEAPGTTYLYRRGGGEPTLTRLFSTRPALDGKPLVPMWPVEIPSRDGKTLVSYLTLPKSADADGDGKPDKPVPLVLLVHGGPWARDYYGYNAGSQWLANRGYATLRVNYRGSTGFGKNFINAGDGEWAGKMHDDLIDAVDWAVKQGVGKKEDVAIMGGSYGGYATLVGLTFTPQTFKCGVDIVGPSNLETLLKTIPPYWASIFEQFARRMGDPRTEAGRKQLAARSPITRVDKIDRPLLIGQGANDPRVNQAESDQIVEAMRKKNIPVTYVLFPDEGHGFARPENSMAFNAVAEGFLAQCLGGRAQPIGADFKGSSISVPAGADGVKGLESALKTHTQQVKK
ncbi:S9 family peptidase [Lysobacter enzymogenes]|uniref:S9 family peptidase n=1 Tax=Lysobacter enzymogenes TaxID=69 RepID=A0A3N2RNU1_LYSEN|nr:S9 family peptidase [Lysobacter enzymogenes]ROU09061.1 S9 family peptidase [Lysobacter enzymogenes]UYD39313.1 S9 family peptidase [Lysobacter enzymogenes]